MEVTDDWGFDSAYYSSWEEAKRHAPLFMPKPSVTVANFASVLKEVWTQDSLVNQLYAESPLSKMFPKPDPKPTPFWRRALGWIWSPS